MAHLEAVADDGVKLAIHHHAGQGEPRRHAVVLMHGLGSNRFQPDLPEQSLARHLAAQGFDCYVPEQRGCGQSERPAQDWDLDDLVRLDLPAVSAAVRARHPGPLHYIGISLGGVVLLCHAITSGGGDIQSGITLGSCLNYAAGHSDYRTLFDLRAVLRHLPGIPAGHLQRALAPLAGTRLGRGFDRFHVNPANVERPILQAVYRDAFHTIPMSLLLSLATTFEPDGLVSRDRSLHYLAEAGAIKAPFQMWAGTADQQCSIAAVEGTARALGGEHEVAIAGRPTMQHDYGHMDFYLGKHAAQEIWPRITGWLARHD